MDAPSTSTTSRPPRRGASFGGPRRRDRPDRGPAVRRRPAWRGPGVATTRHHRAQAQAQAPDPPTAAGTDRHPSASRAGPSTYRRHPGRLFRQGRPAPRLHPRRPGTPQPRGRDGSLGTRGRDEARPVRGRHGVGRIGMTEPDPVLVGIATHRAAYDAFQVAPDGKASILAEEAYREAGDVLVTTACTTSAGAVKLLKHLRWWLADEAEFAQAHQPTYGAAQIRVADLTVLACACWPAVGPDPIPPSHRHGRDRGGGPYRGAVRPRRERRWAAGASRQRRGRCEFGGLPDADHYPADHASRTVRPGRVLRPRERGIRADVRGRTVPAATRGRLARQ
jgi:hypothetical protein